MAKKKYSRDALNAVADRLSRHESLRGYKVENARSEVVTILNRRDQYRKEGLLGGEKFQFQSVYAGKSGQLIFCFRPLRPADYKRIELNVSQLEKLFSSFLQEVEAILETDLDNYLDSYSSVYEEKEAAVELAQKQEAYGSKWGMF